MAATPMAIRRRPFAVEPLTQIMLPDGIFDAAIFQQLITCFFTNTSDTALNDVEIYLESVGDPGILPTAQSHHFDQIAPGASVRLAWLANFQNASPGKKLVSFIAQAQGMSLVRQIKRIFVSRTSYDEASETFFCEVEEGTLEVNRMAVIGPRDQWSRCGDRKDQCHPPLGPWVPARMTMVFHPNPGYEGLHGDLPFSDPWWKILAWIVAAIAAIVAIVAAIAGYGTAFGSVGGTFDETEPSVDCCEPDVEGTAEGTELSIAGVASIVAITAVAVGLSDDADPWWRGQEATPPQTGEVTIAETVDVRFKYPDGAPNAGIAYPVAVAWDYARVTSGQTHTHSVAETRTSEHVSDGIDVSVPAEHDAFAGPLLIEARFRTADRTLYHGDDLYAFAILCSPDSPGQMFFVVPLVDDGLSSDAAANDGVYSGLADLEALYPRLLKAGLKLEGLWRVYVFAQDVNDASEDMLPEIAATHIGGFPIASPVHITFDPSLPCPMRAQATVTVAA